MSHLDRIAEALGTLPWALQQDPPVPLAIGTHGVLVGLLVAAVVEPEEAHKLVATALAQWCRRTSYIAALAAEESQRFALDGTHAGAVSPEGQQAAAMNLWTRASGDVVRAMRGKGAPVSRDPKPQPAGGGSGGKAPTRAGGRTLVAGVPRPVLGVPKRGEVTR